MDGLLGIADASDANDRVGPGLLQHATAEATPAGILNTTRQVLPLPQARSANESGHLYEVRHGEFLPLDVCFFKNPRALQNQGGMDLECSELDP